MSVINFILTQNQKVRLTATGTDGNGNVIPLVSPITWSLDVTALGILGNVSNDGTEIDFIAGTGPSAITNGTVTARSGSLAINFAIQVVASAPVSMNVQTGPIVPASQSGQPGFGLGVGYGQAPVGSGTPTLPGG